MPSFLEDYEPVEDRLRAFWKDHPLGRVETEVLEHAEGNYIVRALIWTDVGELSPRSTGLAQEAMTPQHRVNATWPLENCETSAIGRALANLGYAPKGKRPSREEMSKASVGSGQAVAPGESPKATTGRASGPTGTTSVSVSGKGGAEDASGGSSTSLSPSGCNHRGPSGNLLRLTADGNCPRCGASHADIIKAVEGTEADLGPA